MQRMPAGKSLALTARDEWIFRALSRYRYLRSTYLHAFAGGASATRFKERLGDLFHEGYLDRPERQWEFADARCKPAVYEIGARGKRIALEMGFAEESRTFLSSAPHRQFAHSLLICECLASIDLAALNIPGLRFIPWSEILARAPEATRDTAIPFRIAAGANGSVVPDGLFGLEYGADGKKSYRFFALEADRGTMPVVRTDPKQTSILRKMVAYREIGTRQLHRAHWGIPNLLVLTVTTSAVRLSEIMKQLGGGGAQHAFLFKRADAQAFLRPVPDLLREPWQRAGLPPLCIGKPD
jgi:hypothetical protein